MLNAHAKIGIAQIIFYVPVIAIAVYLLFCRHGRPRMPWILLFAFSVGESESSSFTILIANIAVQSALQEALSSSV